MTSAGNLPGPGSLLSNIGRAALVVASLAMGLVVLAVSATFLLFLLAAIAIVGVIAVGVLWARARLTGRPFGPREHVRAAFAEFTLDLDAQPVRNDAPTLDAYPTPDGWRVDR